MRRMIALVLTVLTLGIGLSACDLDDGNTDKSQQSEDKSRQSGYDTLVQNQPAESMNGYSPTRETKNFWIRTWREKGKLSYVYLLNNEGTAFGYFVLQGLPVSYCTSLIPPYQLKQTDGGTESENTSVVPGPSVDGTFSSGANCNAFYGKDATSGSYMEYTVGQGINALIFDQPMSQFGAAQPLGDATVKSAAPAQEQAPESGVDTN